MKKAAFYILMMLITALGFSQEGCLKFRNGKFKVTDPASKKVCIITRDGDIQTERMEDSDETYDFTIEWINDCTYTVTPTPTTIDRNRDVLKAGTMTVKIVKTTDTSYTQKVRVASNPKFRRYDEVYVVKEEKKEEEKEETDKKY